MGQIELADGGCVKRDGRTDPRRCAQEAGSLGLVQYHDGAGARRGQEDGVPEPLGFGLEHRTGRSHYGLPLQNPEAQRDQADARAVPAPLVPLQQPAAGQRGEQAMSTRLRQIEGLADGSDPAGRSLCVKMKEKIDGLLDSGERLHLLSSTDCSDNRDIIP